MPNGYDKNWIRLGGAIDGFCVRFGHWPTKIRLPEGILNDIKNLFTEASFKKIEDKLEFIIEDMTIVAEDLKKNRYCYGDEGFPKERPEISWEQWLEVHPDNPDNKHDIIF